MCVLESGGFVEMNLSKSPDFDTKSMREKNPHWRHLTNILILISIWNTEKVSKLPLYKCIQCLDGDDWGRTEVSRLKLRQNPPSSTLINPTGLEWMWPGEWGSDDELTEKKLNEMKWKVRCSYRFTQNRAVVAPFSVYMAPPACITRRLQSKHRRHVIPTGSVMFQVWYRWKGATISNKVNSCMRYVLT